MDYLDWRALGGLLLGAALLAQWSSLAAAVLLAGAAFLVLQGGYRAWRGGPLRSRKAKETYWRGRRIDLGPRADGTWSMPVRPPLQTVLCLVFGAGLAVMAVSMILNVAGIG